ncbi:MAG: pilus assembly protein PilM [Phycisphaerae bacterium]|jgi:type IV pilus assembly protein PilM
MAAGARSVWAIDIGNDSLKALRLQQAGDRIEVIGLDYIEHSKILSVEGTSEEEKKQIIRASLATFAGRNELGKDEIAVSVPGQTSFARFIKLPPVEPKKIPEIIKFEAVQQIPFDINEVEWDWQLMAKPDSPEVEVGIFAIKNELIGRHLENFTSENLRVTIVQMAPMALYNYANFDRNDLDDADKKAVILLDMGSDNTNLVICTKLTVWQRCIPLGGNNFTKAIADAFKLDFEKAEKLKRGAPVSKYARQIFHAMKPVFTDFGAEVQRSLGYYSSSHKGTTFTKMVLLGGSFKLQGLNKYIQQTTQLVAVRPDSFEKLVPAANISSAKLHDNICDLAITYGLGIQALGLARIESSLLPSGIARRMMWARKSKFFIIAAGILLAVSLLAFFRTYLDLKACGDRNAQLRRQETENVLQQVKTVADELRQQEGRGTTYDEQIKKQMEVFKYRDVIPFLHKTILKCLPDARNNPEQAELYKAYAKGNIEEVTAIPRNKRKQVFVTSISINYADSLASAVFETSGRAERSGRSYEPTMQMSSDNSSQQGQVTDGKGFVVVIEGYTPYEKIGELMDPVGVGDDKNKWGIVTRMMNLNALFDSNSPFELFSKDKIEHFRPETGVVDIADIRTPAGIGIPQLKLRGSAEEQQSDAGRGGRGNTGQVETADRVTSEQVLVDPLTKEEMSRTFDLDAKGKKKFDSFGQPVYIERDRWFRIKAKFLWKDTLPLQGQPAGM